VTVSDTIAGNTLRFAIFEYSGIAASNSLDVTATSQGTSANPSSGIATTTTSGDLVIGLISTANSATATAGGGYNIQERVPAAPNTKLVVEDGTQAVAGPIAATITLSAADQWGAALAAFRPGAGAPPPPPDLTLTKTHTTAFFQGQTGATYTLTVNNIGSGPTSGAVTLSDTLPSGLTATAMAGSGWACSVATLICTRSDSLAARPAGATQP
jgi:uncharacterized repeat protein (TIGR01451 family)